ncbi:MAG: hypothetical protein OEV29_13025 [Thermoleophilia bacterium]|nr:hypothetical protein [Thermoleophilia bacterium]
MTSLDGFFAGAVPVATSAAATMPERAGTTPPQEEARAEEAAAADEPSGVVEIETPSGIHVYYQAGPKRLYRLRQLFQEDKDFFNWTEVPSMSTVTKCLDKPGLVHWGEKVGINLVQELVRQGKVDLDYIKKFKPNDAHHPPWYGGEGLREIGNREKLTNYHMKDAAASRGNSVHQALEGWAMSGVLADPDVYPEHERGFVVGLNKFLSESRFQPTMSEVIVASIEHKVAGRFDLLGNIPEPVELTYHLTEKNAYRKTFQPCSALVDLKTSAGVFEEYHLQVAGYRGCLIESGYLKDEAELPTGYVLRVTLDGRYELVEVQAEWLDFWFLRGLYDALNGIRDRSRAAAKKGAK